MKKVFLYLYPIEENIKSSLLHDRKLYDEYENPIFVLNECIQKRYRDKGYQVVFTLYPDKDIYSIIPKTEDKIIYTDVLYSEASEIDENGDIKSNFEPKYPNEQSLINQLGNIDELVIGGYHFYSCVKRVGEKALDNGINTIVDLDMTDLFFTLYDQKDYFKIEEYSPERYRQYAIDMESEYGYDIAQKQIDGLYSSPVYKFNKEINERRK